MVLEQWHRAWNLSQKQSSRYWHSLNFSYYTVSFTLSRSSWSETQVSISIQRFKTSLQQTFDPETLYHVHRCFTAPLIWSPTTDHRPQLTSPPHHRHPAHHEHPTPPIRTQQVPNVKSAMLKSHPLYCASAGWADAAHADPTPRTTSQTVSRSNKSHHRLKTQDVSR